VTFFVVGYLGAHKFNGSIQWFTYESADFRVSAVLYLGFHPVALNFALLDVPSTSIMSSHEGPEQTRELAFRPRRFPHDSIIIDGHSGYITLQAFHWLSRNRIPVHVINYDGTIISSIQLLHYTHGQQ
jgi:hypothetical protein